MKRISALLSSLFLVGIAIAQTTPTPAPPECTLSTSHPQMDYVSERSLEALIDHSKFVVDSVVQSAIPVVPQRHWLLKESAVFLTATRVLKGPETLRRFGLLHLASHSELEMLPGQRFVLFLHEESPQRLQVIPQQPGVPNYGVPYVGTFCVESGRVRLGSENVLASRYEGVPIEKALEDIRSYVGLPRLSTNIQVEGGRFLPPVGFKIALRPAESRIDASPLAMLLDEKTAYWTVNPASGPAPRITAINSSLALDYGSYRVDIEGLPPGYDIKSITYGTVDLTKEALRFSSPTDLDLRILLTEKP